MRRWIRTLHDVLNFGDRDAARNQLRHKRQVTYALAALVPFDLGCSVSIIWSPPFLFVT